MARRARPRRAPGLLLACAASVGAVATSGCFYGGGELLYFLGFGQGKLIKAEFRLTDGPILILVDDYEGLIDWHDASRHLVDELAQQLLREKAAKKIIPPRTLHTLRQTKPDFEKRGAREIGRMAGAEQVVWLQVKEFLVEEQFEEVVQAARFTVTVKVLNVLETEDRSSVRLWPSGPAGHLATASLPGDAVMRARTRDGISKALARELAVMIARSFHDYRLGDFESEE